MDTIWMLMARYQGQPIIPVDRVVADFFPHLTPIKFLRKIGDGKLPLPLVRMEASQKSAKGVGLVELAQYLDDRMEEAKKEFAQLYG